MTIDRQNSPTPLLLLLAPGTAHAHSSGDFAFASLSVICLAAGTGAVIKHTLFKRFLKAIQAPGLPALVGVALLEIFLMIAAQIAAIEISINKHTLIIFLYGCLFFLLPSAAANAFLLRGSPYRLIKGVLLAGLFLLLCMLFIPVVFMPLYMLFGV